MKRLNDLLVFVKQNKKKLPLSEIFALYAQKHDLNKYSVRNLYYYGLKQLEEKGEDCGEYERKKLERFSKGESDKLIDYICKNKLKGVSVRKSCMILANYDEKKCIRYINKYRLEMKKQKNVNVDNVVPFVPKNTLSDSDIASLFAGLVKLVKDDAARKAGVEQLYMNEIKQDLSMANEEILSLRGLLRKEKDRNEKLINMLNSNEEKKRAILRVD